MKKNVPPKYLLYADDDYDDRQNLTDMIATIDQDLKIVCVENGVQVINYLSSLEEKDVLPCFILLDINMPVMDGFKTLEILKSKSFLRGIPVILFTTSSHGRDKELAKRLGAERLITKPFSQQGIEDITRQFANFCHELPVRTKEGVEQ
jgi:CheY-like chemotaxis protein